MRELHTDFFRIAYFKENKNVVAEKYLRIAKNIKNYSSKQVVPITCSLEETFFVVGTFQDFASRFFLDVVEKTCGILCSV